MKKIISSALAAILAVSALSTSAFAADTTIVAQGVIAKPAIKVTLPKSMAFVFNPYKLTVDAKGSVSTEIKSSKEADATVLNNDFVVPSYIFDDTTKNSGWLITNNSGAGADLKMAVYAYSTFTEADVFNTIDKTSTKVAATATDKKALKLLVQATPKKADGSDDEAVTIFVHSAALTVAEGKTMLDYASASAVLDGDGSGAAKMPAALIAKIPGQMEVNSKKVEGTCSIKMTGEIQNKGALAWADTDVPAVTFIYSFDFAGGATA